MCYLDIFEMQIQKKHLEKSRWHVEIGNAVFSTLLSCVTVLIKLFHTESYM